MRADTKPKPSKNFPYYNKAHATTSKLLHERNPLYLEVAHYAVMLHSHSKAQQTTDDLSSSLEVEACVDVDHLLVVDLYSTKYKRSRLYIVPF